MQIPDLRASRCRRSATSRSTSLQRFFMKAGNDDAVCFRKGRKGSHIFARRRATSRSCTTSSMSSSCCGSFERPRRWLHGPSACHSERYWPQAGAVENSKTALRKAASGSWRSACAVPTRHWRTSTPAGGGRSRCCQVREHALSAPAAWGVHCATGERRRRLTALAGAADRFMAGGVLLSDPQQQTLFRALKLQIKRSYIPEGPRRSES